MTSKLRQILSDDTIYQLIVHTDNKTKDRVFYLQDYDYNDFKFKVIRIFKEQSQPKNVFSVECDTKDIFNFDFNNQKFNINKEYFFKINPNPITQHFSDITEIVYSIVSTYED